jgi:hypothetical protein
MDRTQRAIRNHYEKGIKDFIHEGLAPPPTVVASGELPPTEAVSQLMELHDDCLRRVRRAIPSFDARVDRDGVAAVTGPLLTQLAEHYGVQTQAIADGFAARDDPGALYDRARQPHRADGTMDMAVLQAECDAELQRNGWDDAARVADAYATPFDPRLPLVPSRIALRADGIAWVSWFRPQNFQVARFDDLRLIHRQSGQWCLELDDWRRRRIAGGSEERLSPDFLDQLRALSVVEGFSWPSATEGHRQAAYDSVIYNVAGWTSEERATLAEALQRAAIPHDWDGSDLRIPRDFEKRVDRIIDRT